MKKSIILPQLGARKIVCVCVYAYMCVCAPHVCFCVAQRKIKH